MNMHMPTPLVLRQLSEEISELSEIPLFGSFPSFSWEKFSQILKERTSSSHFHVRLAAQEWRGGEEMEKLFLKGYEITSFGLSPLSTPAYFAIKEADREKLVSYFLNQPDEITLSEPMQEGFYRYLLLEALDAITTLEPFKDFTAHLTEEVVDVSSGAFCLKLEFELKMGSAWAELILPNPFRSLWRAHFAHLPSVEISREKAEKIPLSLAVKIASVTITRQEWEQIEPGDFIPFGKKEEVLVLGKTQLFSVKIEAGQLRLLHPINTQEAPMNQEEEGSSIKDLPVHITVEVARLKISLNELLHLQPGNVLKLPTHPEQGVFLTVEGQQVGRAELVSLGDTLGIRLLELR